MYNVCRKEWEGVIIGLPHFVIVDGENITIASPDEAMKIMGLK